MVKLPFSKAEIFTSELLSFKEKRQLVKVIEMCLQATDKLAENYTMDADEEEVKEQEAQIKKVSQNSTHVYEKEIALGQEEAKVIADFKHRPIADLLENELKIEKRLQNILLYALGMIN